jgi:DEAD/DEAH box helicase domain-containing protein
LKRLCEVGLVGEVTTAKGSVFGLEPAGLMVHLAPQRVRCSGCARVTSIPKDEIPRWTGQACLRHRCTGQLVAEGRAVASYYQEIYRSGVLRRIFSAEHTGLLEREERESLEARFKATEDREPDAPNLLVATPTLEMGIDIGDLSAVTLCAVPPATANYLQRVGRAGRKTGNAFTFTMASAQPKDLYFFAAPREMLAGEVLPPGAFLDAPYMLYRQLVAFAMDRWAREETEVHNIPPEVRFVLGEAGKRFPGRFIEHYEKHHAQIVPEFLRLFGDILSAETQQKVREFGSVQVLPAQVTEAFGRVRVERDELRALKTRLEKRRQELEADPLLSGDPEGELEDIGVNIKVVTRLVDELGKKYPLNTLTDEGVLPNYSFPEPGVTLKSVVRRRKADKRRNDGTAEAGGTSYDAIEYQRPASSAIRELAPFNSFYADGRRLEINEIDIGNKARPLLERWRFCPRCSHTERVHEPVTEPSAECPSCRATGWFDQGQVRTMVHFRRARSLADKFSDASGDDGDERVQRNYEVRDLIDIGTGNFNQAQVIESLPFGVEFLRSVTLREVNFGFGDSQGAKLDVDGVKVQEQGFVVCAECGRVKKPGFGGVLDHAPFCRHRRAPALDESLHDLYLYRQIESEAIRVLLPVSTIEVEAARASFKAAMDLGFRRRFRGNPQHLMIRYVSEPLGAEGPDRRHFLVIYDTVPGGTGYLPGLWKQDSATGSGLLGVFQLAYDAMRACECRKQPERDGCYRCVLAYQSQRDLPNVSRKKALELLQPVLERRAEMKTVATLSQVSLDDRLESELEVRFRDALRDHAKDRPGLKWEETIHGGKLVWTLRFESGPTWQLEPQVDLGYAQGISKPSRPDFVLRPIAGAPNAKPVAVFCDGLAFHACPSQARARIYDDVEKRQAIIDAEGHVVWSVTWKDIEDFSESRTSKKDDDGLLGILDFVRVKHAFQVAKVDMPADLPRVNTMALLLRYLERPEPERWTRAASVLLATAIMVSSSKLRLSPATYNRLENRIQTRTEHFAPEPMGLFEGDGQPLVLGHVKAAPWAVFMARAQTQNLKAEAYEETRAYLRLFDEHSARQEPSFENSWRQFLSAWNWLQFHAETKVYTSEGLIQDGVQPIDTADLAAEGGSKGYKPALAIDQPKVVELLGLITDEACRVLVRALVVLGVELPEPGYEVEEAGRVVGDVELAWPVRKVAVTVPGQADAARSLESQGWRIFTSDTSPTDLKQTLKLQGS